MAHEFGKVKKCIDSAEQIGAGKKAPSSKDRREHHRHAYTVDAPVVWLSHTNGKASDVTRVETDDISVGGIRIIGRRMLYPGTFGVLKLRRPDESMALVGVEVMHTDYIGDMRYASGCRFMPVPKSLIIKHFIDDTGRMTELAPGVLKPGSGGARRTA